MALVAGAAMLAAGPAAAAPTDLPIEPPSGGQTESPVELPVEAPGTTQSGDPAPAPRAAGVDLIGVFEIEEAVCADGAPTSGSWFQMKSPTGGDMTNNDSPCGDRTYTPLRPGTDGGLSTAGYQPGTDAVTQPQSFFGNDFTVSTQATDPQTDEAVAVPSISDDGGQLSGQTSAWAVHWNGQNFNQGAPKPDGSNPEPTQPPRGTYDPATGRYTLEWQSLIVGGPFDGFTGVWHLEGTFVPVAGSAQGGATSTTQGGGSALTGSTGSTEGAADGTGVLGASGTAGAPASGSGATPRTGGPLPALAGLGLLAAARATRRLVRPGAATTPSTDPSWR